MLRLEAALLRLPTIAAFSDSTAAWLHGTDMAPCDPIEITVPLAAGVCSRAGIAVHRRDLSPAEIVRVRGLPATSIVRTLADLSGRLSLTEAVVLIDAALHGGRVRTAQLTAWADAHAGRRGIRNLRLALQHSDPASESPMESRLRMVLVLGGLPRPRAQVPVNDRWGGFAGRPDLYYERQQIGIEYDGGTHRDAMAEDNRRQNRLLAAGVRLLRFTASDVLGHPDSVVRQVRELLARPLPPR